MKTKYLKVASFVTLASFAISGCASTPHGQYGLRQLKAERGQIRTEAQQQAKSDAAYEEDQNGILADAKAKSSSNYGQYRQASQSWNSAKSERATLVGQVAKVGASIGG